jgi:hypothetical protein
MIVPAPADGTCGRGGAVNSLSRFSVRHWLRGLALLVLTLFASTGAARATTRWATLEAIHNLENPRDSSRPGPFGELGAYQFREMTWRMHTTMPFTLALEREKSDAVAVMHYEWIRHGLEKAGIAASTYNIALAWNGGLDAAIRGSAPARAHDYARRVTNLTLVFDRGTQVFQPGPVVALAH